MPAQGFRGPRQLWAAARWSWQGLCAAWRHEASFRLEAGAAVVLVPLGAWLGDGAVEKLFLVVPAFLVLSAELVNSAIEAVVDLVSPGHHELAGRAKDLGSAAVFVLQLTFVLCWVLVLWPRFA